MGNLKVTITEMQHQFLLASFPQNKLKDSLSATVCNIFSLDLNNQDNEKAFISHSEMSYQEY